MNLPNKLTILRMILVVPFIVILSLAIKANGNYFYQSINAKTILFIIAGILFLIAMMTDYFDGYLARKHNMISTFGKLFDPLADKFITTSALIILSIDNIVPFYIVIIFILRDILVDGSRNLAAANKLKIKASIWGKLKTILMTISIIIIFFVYPTKNSFTTNEMLILNIPLILSAILSVISGYKYLQNIIPLINKK